MLLFTDENEPDGQNPNKSNSRCLLMTGLTVKQTKPEVKPNSNQSYEETWHTEVLQHHRRSGAGQENVRIVPQNCAAVFASHVCHQTGKKDNLSNSASRIFLPATPSVSFDVFGGKTVVFLLLLLPIL